MMLLHRVFGEQYEVDDNGNVTLRDKAKISSTSVQNPTDPDAAYRSKGGKKTCRYFNKEAVERNKVRRQTDSIPWDERKKRNNVEATIFQYCFHTRNNKTRYRELIKHTLQAIARCAWINAQDIPLQSENGTANDMKWHGKGLINA